MLSTRSVLRAGTMFALLHASGASLAQDCGEIVKLTASDKAAGDKLGYTERCVSP